MSLRDILVSLKGRELSPTARMVAALEAEGVTDQNELAELCGRTVRMIQIARKELRCETSFAKPVSQDEASFAKPISQGETHFAETKPISQIEHRPSRARIETPSGLLISSGLVDTHPLPPQPAESEARVGETAVGHGVFVNCETIRHKAFAISLPGVEMYSVRAGWSKDQIKSFCQAHAMQWAAEIENGKAASSVLPAKIANFLAASIMSMANGEAVHGVRIAKAAPRMDRQSKASEMRAALARMGSAA